MPWCIKFKKENCVKEKKLRKQDSFPCGRLSFFYLTCGGKLQTIDNTYLLEYFWSNGGMRSDGSVWLSTGLRVWVVSVYSYGVKSLVRGVWLALWRLGFCVSVWGMLLCLWVGLVWLGLAWGWHGFAWSVCSVGFGRLRSA